MSVKVFYEILNQRDTPAMFADVFSNRPAFGYNGRIFISIDTKQIYRDYGTFWDLIADAGAGSGTLQTVCTNGSQTTTDITIVSPGRLFLQALSNGGVLFPAGGSGQVSQSANLFWDNTNNRLGINTNTPTATFDIHSTSSVMMQLNQQGLNNSLQSFLLQGVGKWRIGNFYNAGDNDFYIYDVLSGTPRFYITNTGYTILPTNVIIGSSNRSSAYGLDSYVSANFQSTLRVQGASTFLSQINGTFAVFTGDLTIATNKFFVNSSTGNIGMGTITPEAIANYTTLEIDGTNGSFVRTGTSAYGGYFATIPTADVMVLSNVRNPVTGTFSNTGKAASVISLYGEANNGYITFNTSPTNNTGPIERMRILSTGKILTGGATTGFGNITVYEGTNDYANISLQTQTSTRWYVGAGISAISGNYFAISTSNNNTSPYIAITNGGNVLIGTTTDAGGKLQVNGEIRVNTNTRLYSQNQNVSTSSTQVSAGTIGVGALYFCAWYNTSGGAQGIATVMTRGSTVVIIAISDGSGAVVTFSASSGSLFAATTSGTVNMTVAQILN